MNKKMQDTIHPIPWRRYAWLLAICWTIVIGSSFAWGIYQIYNDNFERALSNARGAYNNDLLHRRWASMHGGLYVPITDESPPNTYLTNVAEQNITTPSGRSLTLINPTYMIRQVHQMAKQQYGLRGHITSLNPINPINKPDSWEINALRAFENGKTEVSSIVTIAGEDYARFMKPMITEEPCLKCHASQGYKVGDIRGGISITTSMTPYKEMAGENILYLIIVHGVIWFFGISGIVIATKRNSEYEEERLKIDKALRKSEQTLIDAQKMAHLGNWEWNIITNELKWSDEIYRIFGLTPQSFGATYDAFINSVHPDDRDYVNLYVDEALKNKRPYSIEHRVITSNDDEKYVHEQGEVLFDDNDEPIRMLGTVQDITEQKIAELEIQRQSKLLSGVNVILKEALISNSDEELAEVCLKVAEELTESEFGFIDEINEDGKINSIAISDPGWDARVTPKTNSIKSKKNSETRDTWSRAIKEKRSVIINNPTSDPEWRGVPEEYPLINSLLEVPLWKENEIVGVISLANKKNSYDIIDKRDVETLSVAFMEALMRKRAELEIQKLNEELEQRVIDRTAQLNAANKELEAFAYSVSHDLRAPLRHVNGFIDLLKKNIIDKVDDEAARYINIISESTNRLGIMIDGLLQFSRITRSEINRTEINTEELLSEIIREMQFDVKDRDIKWNIENLPNINGDPSLLKLVFTNLLTNAIKYTRLKEVAIIDIGVQFVYDAKITLFVRDNGVGFDMKYYDKLFGVFNRLHNEREFEGTGIGLATVQRIIHRHGGKIWAEGKVNEGATFFIALPKTVGK